MIACSPDVFRPKRGETFTIHEGTLTLTIKFKTPQQGIEDAISLAHPGQPYFAYADA